MNIWVLDDKYETLAILDVFDSIVWTTRFNDVCAAEIVTYPFDNVLNVIKMGRYLMQNNSDRYMMIEDLEIVEDAEEGDKVTIKIEDLASILKRRVINIYTTFKCSLQEAVQKLLNDYFITPSDSLRRVPGFVFEASSDPRVGQQVETTFLGETVFEAIQTMCKSCDVGFKVVPYGEGHVKFSLYAGTDRSYNQTAVPPVIFSETFENLINSRYYESVIDSKNVMYVGGEGKGPEQFIVEVNPDNVSGLARRETWTEVSVSRRTDKEDEEGNPVDLTDEEYTALLVEKGSAELIEYTPIQLFDGEIDAERQFVLDRDFFIGDVVQVINKWGYENTCRVVEIVECEDDSDGHRYYPTFSSLEQHI